MNKYQRMLLTACLIVAILAGFWFGVYQIGRLLLQHLH